MSLSVVIGRFQPFHDGHEALISKAFEISDRVLVLIGSKNSAQSIKNPFCYETRKNMIESAGFNRNRLMVSGIDDFEYNDVLWASNVRNEVSKYSFPNEIVTLVGYSKDETSFYLQIFPEWNFRDVGELEGGISATDVRKDYFEGNRYDRNISNSTKIFMESFRNQKTFKILKEEYDYVKEYKKQFESLPYPPVFVTTDAVCTQSGHILLVERGKDMGIGTFALPGGFLDANGDSSLLNCVIRELREETGLKVPEKVLKGSVVSTRAFDAKNRSLRGRTITHAFLIHLDDTLELPRVKGSDDARKAFWYPLSKLDEVQFFEDHRSIIREMTGI